MEDQEKQEQEEQPTLIEALLKKAEDYGKTSIELLKLKAVDKTSDIIATFVSGFGAFILIFAVLLFLSIGACLWLGEILGNTYYGFFIVSGFYLVLAILYYIAMHTWVKTKIINTVISKCLDKENC